MAQLIGLSGSLRLASFNTALLKTAAQLAPEGCRIEVRTIHGIPLYDADLEEREGIPPTVAQLKDAIAAADGLLLATPEYNNSIPGVFKNAIDWLSRPAADIARVFGGKPVAIMGASPGNFGTLLSRNAWQPVLRTLGTAPWFDGRLIAPHAAQLFGADGELIDATARARLQAFVTGFCSHVAGLRTA